jgi:hypothetical protein
MSDAVPIKSYVFENTEIILTGRTASKPLRSGKLETLYEITPKLNNVGAWHKWVRMEEMFEVND